MPIVVVTTTGGGSATVRSEDSTFEGVRANSTQRLVFLWE